MKRVLGYLALGSVGLLALLLGVAFLLPREVRVERSAVIPRPACTLSAVLDGFGPFPQWSPWALYDPDIRYAFEGPRHGVGAKMSWESAEIGDGSQEITAVAPCQRIDLALDLAGQRSAANFTFEPVASGTRVTWGVDNDLGMNPIGRYFGTMLDGLIGPDFERGLANLAVYAEKLPATDFAGLVVEAVEVAPVEVALVTTTAAKDGMAVGVALANATNQLDRTLAAVGLSAAGPSRVSYRSEGPGYAIDVMVPVVGTPSAVLTDGPVRLIQAFAGPALKTVHSGGWETREETWAKLEAWRASAGIEASGVRGFEEYLSDPATTATADLKTALFLPVSAPAR